MIGKVILNYRVDGLIGKGGMGSVYLATNLHIQQKVAIKALNGNLADNPAIRERFRQEAKNLLALDHPGIVKFLNFVENDDGLFIIMEYIDGITLEDFINQKNGLIVEKRAYPIFDQVLDAMAYAHQHKIVHRDIKPANIILTGDGNDSRTVKVLDFGIAQIISDSADQEKGWIVGTPAYMSPEQVEGNTIDERSDIYSLGVLLHQMLTGHAPYDSTTLSEFQIQRKVVTTPLPQMRDYYPDISLNAQAVVDTATQKKAEARYLDCNQFRKAWKDAVYPPHQPKKATWLLIAIFASILLIPIGYFLVSAAIIDIFYEPEGEFYSVEEMHTMIITLGIPWMIYGLLWISVGIWIFFSKTTLSDGIRAHKYMNTHRTAALVGTVLLTVLLSLNFFILWPASYAAVQALSDENIEKPVKGMVEKPAAMVMTLIPSDTVRFYLSGSGSIDIDWGDGTESEGYTCNDDGEFYAVTHYFSANSPTAAVITVSGNNITGLECYDIQLMSLNVSQNTALTALDCCDNLLSDLDVSKNNKLERLVCSNNGLHSLYIRENFMLAYLDCDDNELTDLDVSQNANLMYLLCRNNLFKTAALNSILNALHGNALLEKIVHIGENPGTDDCNIRPAIDNGWKVYE